MQEKFAFSNFQAARVRCDLGVEYPTVEHAFQAMKSLDGSERLVIAALETPGRAKRAGRKVQLRPDWEQVSESVMRHLLRQKFRAGTPHAERLLATGDAEIVEWNAWHDTRWGRCTCEKCGGRGENRLGRALMRVRAELQRS